CAGVPLSPLSSRAPPTSTLFPYTTLFRSRHAGLADILRTDRPADMEPVDVAVAAVAQRNAVERETQLGFTLDGIPLGDGSYGNVNGLHISRAISSENIGETRVSRSEERRVGKEGRCRGGT